MPPRADYVKRCNRCSGSFFLSLDNSCGIVVPLNKSTVYLCSPYCRALWFRGEYVRVESDEEEDDVVYICEKDNEKEKTE